MAKAAARYRIQTVAELTGVQEATLRAWERRYGVPAPARTDTGYRLYTHKDVETVKRMVELCARGMAPSDAARALGSQAPVEEPPEAPKDAFEATVARIVDAARRMDALMLESEVRFALTLGDAHTIVARVFCPVMEQIGLAWQERAISVAHEHLAAEIVCSAMRDLLRLVAPARPAGEVLLACFAEEDHSLPLYAAAFRFVAWGHRTHVLGARTPPDALAHAVRELDPSAVGLSITMSVPGERAAELVHGYADAIGARPWVVGGAAAASTRAAVEARGGVVLARDMAEQDEVLGRLLT